MARLYGPNGGRLVRPPRRGTWWELLPEPWDENLYVVVVMVPSDSKPCTLKQKDSDKVRLGCVEYASGKIRGIQVLTPQLSSYLDHSDVFEQCRVEMIDPHYVGLLSGLRDELLLSDDFKPMLLQRDAMWRPALDLRQYCTGQREDAHVN